MLYNYIRTYIHILCVYIILANKCGTLWVSRSHIGTYNNIIRYDMICVCARVESRTYLHELTFRLRWKSRIIIRPHVYGSGSKGRRCRRRHVCDSPLSTAVYYNNNNTSYYNTIRLFPNRLNYSRSTRVTGVKWITSRVQRYSILYIMDALPASRDRPYHGRVSAVYVVYGI